MKWLNTLHTLHHFTLYSAKLLFMDEVGDNYDKGSKILFSRFLYKTWIW